ncbi:MAG: hypothetical protein ACRC5F_05970, partial [Cetobacterium sp.]
EIEELMMFSKILNISNIFYDNLLLEENDFEIEINEDEIIFYIKDRTEEDLKMIDLFISEKKFVNTFDRSLKYQIDKKHQ